MSGPTALGLALALLLPACEQADAEPAPISAGLAWAAHTSDPAAVAIAPVVTSGILIETAWMAFDDVHLVLAEQCDDPGAAAVPVPGLTTRNLLQPVRPTQFPAAPTSYCRLVFRLAPAHTPIPVGAPVELLDRSAVITGRTRGGVPFRIVSSSTDVIVLEGTTAFAIDYLQPALAVSLDVARSLSEVDLDSGTPAGAGRIEIHDFQNVPLLDGFHANLREAFRLYRDTDQDGTLEAEERSTALAEATP